LLASSLSNGLIIVVQDGFLFFHYHWNLGLAIKAYIITSFFELGKNLLQA
jgi:hypothetical protein